MNKLINALLNPLLYDHAVDKIELVETHISWVLLTGDFAYKIKKPVNFGFLDFSSLEKRKFYCEEELRLNRRFAPQLYLDLITITGTEDLPSITSTGDALEYAVKMKQFPSDALLSKLLDAGDLREPHMDWLAQSIADFHLQAEIAKNESKFGNIEAVAQPVSENFQQIRHQIQDPDILLQLDSIEKWSTEAFKRLEPEFRKRKQEGFIRECHGDLHLGNIILLHEKVIPFDCLEFNENLRWIDVLSEIAFLVMDLDENQRPDLSRRLLNKYLEHTGDYSNLAVLQYYMVYRAMVRAKVNALQLNQDESDQRKIDSVLRECKSYITLGNLYITDHKPLLIIMHGFSGSGKTTISQFILEALPVIRIRSDVERKRLLKDQESDSRGEVKNHKTQSEINEGIYNKESSNITYDHLRTLAEDIILAGMSVIVDAAFLQIEQRKQFSQLASMLNVPFRIIDCHAEHSILKQRITERQVYGSDASDASLDVLFHQQENHDPLSEEEISQSFSMDRTEASSIKTVTDHLLAMMHGHSAPDSFSDNEILKHS
jgi:aminoglycoside phosphotransferase family enzyme/adenylate kinase family enzyme